MRSLAYFAGLVLALVFTVAIYAGLIVCTIWLAVKSLHWFGVLH